MASATAHLATVAAKGTMALPRPSSSGTARPATLVLHVTGKEIVYFPAFPLRSSAAVRLSSLLRAKSGAQDGEGAHGEPDELCEEMVFQVLARECEHSVALLSRLSVPVEEEEAAATLKAHFTNMATAAKEGKIDKSAGVRGLISGVYQLIELTHRCFPSAPRATTQTSDEEFVSYFMSIGVHYPEISSAFAYTESMGQYPDDPIDKGLLGSMITSMNLARVVVNGLNSNVDILQQLPPVADATGVTLPVLEASDGKDVPKLQVSSDSTDQSPSDAMDSAGGLNREPRMD